MKVRIVGVGAVGKSCAMAMILRGSCREIVLLDNETPTRYGEVFRLDEGVATDLSHGAVLCPPVTVRHGGYSEFGDSAIVVITAGFNEEALGATDKNDPCGRLRLLEANAKIYSEIVPRIVEHAREALILVVTDPPDPLADVARRVARSDKVMSAGTFLDSIRLRWQIAKRLGCAPSTVDAQVLGEHGTSQVYAWSTARVGGHSVLERVESDGGDPEAFRLEVEEAVKFANIDIINGTGASQHGIGIVTARIVEAVLRDEGLVEPVGTPFTLEDGTTQVTLSLPSVLRRGGVDRVLRPKLSADESDALERSGQALAKALGELA